MNRFEIVDIPLSDYERIVDNVTGEDYYIEFPESQRVLKLLNQLAEKNDKLAEANTTPELLKLKWQRDIYKRFCDETMNVLSRHEVESLAKLDQILFNQVKW